MNLKSFVSLVMEFYIINRQLDDLECVKIFNKSINKLFCDLVKASFSYSVPQLFHDKEIAKPIAQYKVQNQLHFEPAIKK